MGGGGGGNMPRCQRRLDALADSAEGTNLTYVGLFHLLLDPGDLLLEVTNRILRLVDYHMTQKTLWE